MNRVEKYEVALREVQQILTARAMTRNQLALALGIHYSSAERYVKELRRRRLVHIECYKRGVPPARQFDTFFRTGDLPDAKKIAPLPKSVYDHRYWKKLAKEGGERYLHRARWNRLAKIRIPTTPASWISVLPGAPA